MKNYSLCDVITKTVDNCQKLKALGIMLFRLLYVRAGTKVFITDDELIHNSRAKDIQILAFLHGFFISCAIQTNGFLL